MAHLLDEVLAALPARRWIVTVPFPFPFPRRLRMAHDADFSRSLRRAFGDALLRAIEGELRARLGSAAPRRRDPSGRRIATGAVTVVQRFGSGLNLHVLLPTRALDGAFVGDPERGVRFVDIVRFRNALVGAVLEHMVDRRVERGILDDVPDDEGDDDPIGELVRDFATLMKRGRAIDVLRCPAGDGRMRLHQLADHTKLARARAEADAADAASVAPLGSHPRRELVERGGARWCDRVRRPPTREGLPPDARLRSGEAQRPGETSGAPGPAKLPPQVHDREAATRLWTISEELSGVALG